MLLNFKGYYIDPTKVVKLSAGVGTWNYSKARSGACNPLIWIALGGKDYIHFPAKIEYTRNTSLKDNEVDWNSICADELAEIAQEINSLLKATKCKN